jgi:hypothetical protein
MKLNKTIITYILFTIGIYLFDKIYAIFGHGVTSHWMANAYLYLLGLGVLVFVLFRIFIPEIVTFRGYPLFFKIYNSGIAILINGMLLYGIIEIAGGTSSIVAWFLYIGSGVIVCAGVMLIIVFIGKLCKSSQSSQT